jgi:DNA-binding protein YbaB
MSSPVDSSGLDRLLGQTMQALDQLRGAPADGDDGAESEPVEGVGEAADGLIRAVAISGGQLSGLYVDPSALHMGANVLAQEIVYAVNAAMADLQEQVANAFGSPDLDALAGQLKEVQEESNRQMGMFLDALTDAQSRIAGQARQS